MKKEEVKFKQLRIYLDKLKKAAGIKKDFKKWRLDVLQCVIDDINQKEIVQILFTNDLKGKFFKK